MTAEAKLRVLQVIPSLDTGGAERTAVDVAAAVVKAGGTAWIATEGGRLAGEAESKGARLITGNFAAKNPLQIWTNAARLQEIVRRERIAIVHARSRAPAWSAYIAARRTGAKFVATYHGIYNARGPLKRYYNGIMTKGSAVIANSQFTADHVMKEHGVEPERMIVIPRGIDIKAFTPNLVDLARIEEVRKQWGLRRGKPVILMPGRLTRWKGQLDFIRALAHMKDLDFEAVLAGDAQERDGYVSELREEAEKAGVAQKIRIPGRYSDGPATMMVADVVVAPSIEPEAFGRIAVEAQAMGKPIVASRLGAQTETVVDGVTGFLFEPGNVEALAKAIKAAMNLNDEQKAAMVAAQRARVMKLYTVEAMCTSTLNVYRKLLSA